MTSFVVFGTDTDAGKTSFCLLWMAAFQQHYAYWKPVETGDSDSGRIRSLLPSAQVFPPIAQFQDAVAPALAARRVHKVIPRGRELALGRPESAKPLVVETFGSPFSPLNETELQLAFLHALDLPACLVTPSSVGAVGRTLQVLAGLESSGTEVVAVVLLGPTDPYAAEQIQLHAPNLRVFSLQCPTRWQAEELLDAASGQMLELEALRRTLSEHKPAGSATDLVARDRKSLWHPYTSLADPVPPLAVAGVEQEFLKLEDGRELIDAVSSWWTTLHGHRPAPLMAALRQAMRRFDHVLFAGVTHEPAVELAELLLQSSPLAGGRVFYSDNGSTAVEVALKMAYQYWCHRGEPERTLFVSFENGYHGDTFGAMAVGRDPVFFGRFEPLLFRTLQIPVSAERLSEILAQHLDQVAAIVIEPLVQGAGGMRMHSPGELKAICDVAQSHGVLLIADEVMTGGGRTGTLWAHEQAGITPDLICAGKTLTGGMMPLAATLVSPQIVDAFMTTDRTRTFFHGHSYTAHPLACAVAATNWRILLEGNWREDAQRIERHWRNWAESVRGMRGIAELRVCGTILAMDLVGSPGYLSELGPRIRELAIDRGVLIRPLGNVVYSMPPLCTSDASLKRITETITNLVEHLEQAKRPG